MTASDLVERFRRRKATVGVVGLGYVGLPLSLAFADRGFHVLGFEIDRTKVERISAGSSYVGSISDEDLKSAVSSGLLEATDDFTRLSEPDAILICVPTPLGADRLPDLGYVEQTARQIRDALREGQLVVLESTTYPGTTREVILPLLESTGLECGEQFFLAYSPERENPGDALHSASTIPKVVGGLDSVSGDLAEALYDQVAPAVVRVSAASVAEASKLTENIFRAINISLVNELKMVFDGMGIDIWEVLDAASTKPFGFMRFDPGPGLGGHCIPIDPFYLAARAKQYGMDARMIELAGQINTEMPGFVVAKTLEALKTTLGGGERLRVLVLGLAYKRDVDDPRESPAFEILSQFFEAEVDVNYHDPHIPRLPRMRSWPDIPDLESVPLEAELLRGYSAVVIVTDHRAIDWDLVWENAALIVDTRGVYRREDPRLIRA